MGKESEGAHWNIGVASVQGTRHERIGAPCEDSSGSALLSNDVVVLAVGDGAGTAEHARLASVRAVETALAFLTAEQDGRVRKPARWEEVLRDALAHCRGQIETYAEELNAKPKDLATTLILVIASRSQVASAQIGDGAAVIEAKDGTIFALTKPDAAGYANETVFLTSEDSIEKAQCRSAKGPVKGVGVITDGLQWVGLEMPQGKPFAGFFSPLLNWLSTVGSDAGVSAELKRFLESDRIRSRTDDDVTIALAAAVEG